ncbi:MAG: NUDIX domain-containing protein [Tildeniella nuda ZEHNDER 1965/U140]|jgi:ADP-ribose pyrophosphatase|nr:NUDIX domain-containing protein [Tildeniella nuda ZEHNDER 1965/U140]
MDHLKLRCEKFDGHMSTTQDYFVVGVGKRAVGVLAYDPISDCVVLVEQFRVGAYVSRASVEGLGWTTEIVMGTLTDGEKPEALARLELNEEIGCEPEDIIEIFQYLPDPASNAALVQLFCARVKAPKTLVERGNAYEQENVRPCIVSCEKIPNLLTEASCANASTLLALQWFLLNRTKVRHQWLLN